MTEVTFSNCLEQGVRYGALKAALCFITGNKAPVIVSVALGDLIGITVGNYLNHHHEEFVDFEEQTQRIVVAASIFFASCSVFGALSLASRSLKLEKFAYKAVFTAFIHYVIHWGYLPEEQRY